MTQRIDLPSGGWAELRDPIDVCERLRRPVVQAMGSLTKHDIEQVSPESADGTDPAVLARFQSLNDLVAVALVESWSFDAAVTVANLQELPGRDYDAVLRAVSPMVSGLLPDFSPSREAVADPKATTPGDA